VEAHPEVFPPEYVEVQPVASGGFSTVYRARQPRLGRTVALKVLVVQAVEEDDLRRFRREAELMGSLSGHANIVSVYDANVTQGGRPYLVMEYCPGGTLQDRIRDNGALPVADVVDIGQRLARALNDAHSAGIVHRDIKPANVLFRAFGEPALGDFGLSLRPDLDVSRGLDALTVVHAAPETLENGTSDQRSDVYMLGSTLYTCLQGEPPFPVRPGEPPLQHSLRVLSASPPPLSGVPAAVDQILLQMLAKDPAERPEAAAVAARLDGLRSAMAATAVSPAHVGDDITTERGDGLIVANSPRPPARPRQPEAAPPSTGAAIGAPTGALAPDGDPTRLRSEGTEPPPKHGGLRRAALVTSSAVVLAVLAGGVVGITHTVGGRTPEDDPSASPSATLSTATAPPGSPSTQGSSPQPEVTLKAPVDQGGSVLLTWKGPVGFRYNVFVAEEGGAQAPGIQTSQTSLTVPVHAGKAYCFQVKGTDLRRVLQSNVQPLRGAVCRR